MKKVKLILAVVATVATISANAVERAESSLDLTPGAKAPNFSLKDGKDSLSLNSLKGKYILLQFWTNNESSSLTKCIAMDNALKKLKNSKIAMIAISFEPLRMIYDDIVKSSKMRGSKPIFAEDGVYSEVYRKYNLDKGLSNYLIDENGTIIAKDLNPESLAIYSKQIK